MVKYWPEKSVSGFIVWKYLLRRDDTVRPPLPSTEVVLCMSPTCSLKSPAPWTTEGKKMAKKLGLTMQYPEGYLESQQANGKGSSGEEEEEKQVKKRGKKRKSSGE